MRPGCGCWLLATAVPEAVRDHRNFPDSTVNRLAGVGPDVRHLLVGEPGLVNGSPRGFSVSSAYRPASSTPSLGFLIGPTALTTSMR
jgi:hypothetical protein